MIIVSGVLVVAAIGLLIDGVFFSKGTSGWQIPVYASIAASVIAGALLAIGAYLRKDEFTAEADERPEQAAQPLPGVAGDDTEVATASTPTPRPMPVAPAEPATHAEPEEYTDAAIQAAAQASGGEVLVIAGRPRYHLAGCRYVTDRPEATPLTVDEARHAGYTPCGVCKPDELIAFTSADDADVYAEELAEAQRLAGSQQAQETASAPDPTPVVVVRNTYHRPECRYVAVASERRDATKGQARADGALPCGVCRP